MSGLVRLHPLSMIAEWSTEGGFSSETGTQAVPPGRGKFLLKIGKNPGTPFEVKLTATELDVNNTNRGWEQLRERHRTSRATVGQP